MEKSSGNLNHSDSPSEIRLVMYWHIIDFLVTFPKVLMRPRTFYYELANSRQTVLSALIYLISSTVLVSLVLVLILSSKLGDGIRLGLLNFVGIFFSTLVCGLLMAFIWRVLGRRIITERTYVIYLYHAATFNLLNVILAFTHLLVSIEAINFCVRIDGELVETRADVCYYYAVVLDWVGVVGSVLLMVVMSIWGVGAWCSYHDQFLANKFESVVYFVLYCLGAIFVSMWFVVAPLLPALSVFVK